MTATGAHVVVIGNDKGGDDEAGYLATDGRNMSGDWLTI